MTEDPFASEESKEPVSLGDAATEALDGLGGGEDVQEPMIPACKIKFLGVSFDSLDDIPQLKDEMTFTVHGRVVAHGQHVLASGEIRDVASVQVETVTKVD